jgi:hypothetical protein
MLFTQIRQPDSDYLLIPRHTSENRLYIPIGFVNKKIISSDANYIIPSASLMIFGILTSSVHMAWVRVLCGRLGLSYRYTPAIYNCFPWCEPNDTQRTSIENSAQDILNVRMLFRNNSLADLYDPHSMPPELLKVHYSNDSAVIAAYKFSKEVMVSDDSCVAKLMKIYSKITTRYR